MKPAGRMVVNQLRASATGRGIVAMAQLFHEYIAGLWGSLDIERGYAAPSPGSPPAPKAWKCTAVATDAAVPAVASSA